ncbi:MAG: AI-2E family transporter [Planctomycetaceae bacterium]|nr:AI-2E family transporter [Planctomycetaceae bacterium]
MSKKVRLPFEPSDHGPGPHYSQTPKQEFVFRALIITAAIVIVLAGIKAASGIIAPMLLALFATIILLVPLRWLQSKGCPRILALVIVLGCVAIFFFVLTRMVVGELTKLREQSQIYALKIEREFQRVEVTLAAWGFKLPPEFDLTKKNGHPDRDDEIPLGDDTDSPQNNENGKPTDEPVTDIQPPAAPPMEPSLTVPMVPTPDVQAGDIMEDAVNLENDVDTDEADPGDKTLFAHIKDTFSVLFPPSDEDDDFLLEADDMVALPLPPIPPAEPSLVELNAQSVMVWFTKTIEIVRHLIERSFLVFIIALFMIFEAARFPAKIDRAFGKGPITNEHLHKIATEIRRYLFLKSITSIMSGIAATLVYLWFGVPGALFWGLVACFLYFIPNLGGIIASIVPGLLIFMDGGVPSVLAYAVCLITIECTLAYGIDPKILGHGLGISTVVIILSLIIWGWLLGAIGLFLAAPLTIMVKIILQAFKETEWVAILIGDGSHRSQ